MTIKIKTRAEVEAIGKLRQERFTYKAIADRFGVNWATVRDICKKHGYEPLRIVEHSLQTDGERA